MRNFLVILTISILSIILLQSFTTMSSKTEAQKYSVVRKYRDFEIRFYPSATFATITSNAKTYKELSGPGFQKLAGYIFGGNESNLKISMTKPVQMDINDSASTMSFLMPSEYEKESLPKPVDPGVTIKNTADEYVAAIGFGGYASDEDLKFYSQKLGKLLEDNGITPVGHYRFLGYNPPFQFLGRRNEIIVSVMWKEE